MTRKRKGGRPRKAVKRDRQITIRLTADQYSRISRKAAGNSISEFVRSAALNRKSAVKSALPELNKAAWVELSRTASNLNQLAYHANTGQFGERKSLVKALWALHHDLERVRRSLIGAENGDR